MSWHSSDGGVPALGASDDVEFALGIFPYAAELSKRGVDVSVSELAGAGHEILLDTRVRNAIKSTLAEL